MFELISILMCGGGGGQPAPYVPQPLRVGTRAPSSAVKRRQTQSKGGGAAMGATTGTLFAGTQGIGDQSLMTGKTLLGG